MKEKDLVWLPKDLADKVKEFEDKEELKNALVLEYIDKTKRDISQSIEMLDDDVLCYRGKLASYRNALKEAYSEEYDKTYEAWEDAQNKLKDFDIMILPLKQSLQSLSSDVVDIASRINNMQKSFESFNTYHFERITAFLKAWNEQPEDVKEMFKKMMINTDV
jgi:predicted nuclease with TOPRIM domain